MTSTSWEPSDSDRTFLVSGSLSVAKSSGHSELSYSHPVSVAAANSRAASGKVRAMLLLRAGLTDADVLEDALEVVPKPHD